MPGCDQARLSRKRSAKDVRLGGAWQWLLLLEPLMAAYPKRSVCHCGWTSRERKPSTRLWKVPQKGDLPLQGVCTQNSLSQNRESGPFSAHVPASPLSSHCKDRLVQTGKGPLLPGPELPGFSPRPAPNSFQKLSCQVQSSCKFLLVSPGLHAGF